MRVVLADDEAMIRAGVRAILASDPAIEIVAEAANGVEAVTMVHEHDPDLVLLDIRMPRLDGLGAAERIRQANPDVGIIMLTTFGEDEYIARALGAGVGGFLLKSGDPRELISGMYAVADGAAFLSPQVARRVIDTLAHSTSGGRLTRSSKARAAVEKLTGREREVLTLLGSGLSNAEIARRIHVVEGTVKSYVSAIFARLEVRNRVQAAIIAHEADLVDGLA